MCKFIDGSLTMIFLFERDKKSFFFFTILNFTVDIISCHFFTGFERHYIFSREFLLEVGSGSNRNVLRIPDRFCLRFDF